MSEDEVRITLRLPRKLRDQLSEASDASKRSMNAEIVLRIEASFNATIFGTGNRAFIEAIVERMFHPDYLFKEVSDEELRAELHRRSMKSE